jgi:Sulfotransferase family
MNFTPRFLRNGHPPDDGPRRQLNFVVCPSFHGATLLALLLNNHSRLSALGDTIPSREYDQLCACRLPVSRCDFWQTIAHRLNTDQYSSSAAFIPMLPWPLWNHGFKERVSPLSGVPVVSRFAGTVAGSAIDSTLRLVWRVARRSVDTYAELYTAFYDAICDLHGTTLVVDGSKSWPKVRVLADHFGVSADVRVIHLVRDPRGFVASLRRRSEGPASVSSAATRWRDLHQQFARLTDVASYTALRYEDLCAHPVETMERMFEFLSVPTEDVVGAPRFPAKHHLMGNVMLFTFDGRLEVDEGWRTQLTPHEQEQILRHAGALAKKFGYV